MCNETIFYCEKKRKTHSCRMCVCVTQFVFQIISIFRLDNNWRLLRFFRPPQFVNYCVFPQWTQWMIGWMKVTQLSRKFYNTTKTIKEHTYLSGESKSIMSEHDGRWHGSEHELSHVIRLSGFNYTSYPRARCYYLTICFVNYTQIEHSRQINCWSYQAKLVMKIMEISSLTNWNPL